MAFYQDEEIFFRNTFYSDPEKVIPVDPGTVTLTLEAPDGTEIALNVTEDGARPANTGKYIASHIVDKWGVWGWRWYADNDRFVKQGTFKVQQNILTD